MSFACLRRQLIEPADRGTQEGYNMHATMHVIFVQLERNRSARKALPHLCLLPAIFLLSVWSISVLGAAQTLAEVTAEEGAPQADQSANAETAPDDLPRAIRLVAGGLCLRDGRLYGSFVEKSSPTLEDQSLLVAERYSPDGETSRESHSKSRFRVRTEIRKGISYRPTVLIGGLRFEELEVYDGVGRRLSEEQFRSTYGAAFIPALLTDEPRRLFSHFSEYLSVDALILSLPSRQKNGLPPKAESLANGSEPEKALTDKSAPIISDLSAKFEQVEIDLTEIVSLGKGTELVTDGFWRAYAVPGAPRIVSPNPTEQQFNFEGKPSKRTLLQPIMREEVNVKAFVESATQLVNSFEAGTLLLVDVPVEYTMEIQVAVPYTEQQEQTYSVTVPYKETVVDSDGVVRTVNRVREEIRTRTIEVTRSQMETRTYLLVRNAPMPQTQTFSLRFLSFLSGYELSASGSIPDYERLQDHTPLPAAVFNTQNVEHVRLLYGRLLNPGLMLVAF